MDLNSIFNRTWKACTAEPGFFFGGFFLLFTINVLAVFLSLFLVGIPLLVMGIVFHVNYIYGFIKVFRNEKVEFTDLFELKNFWRILGLILLMGLIIFLGYLSCIIPGIVISVFLMYSQVIIRDRECTISDALGSSYELVTQRGFWMNFLLLLIIIPALNFAGSLLILGTFLTGPVGIGLIAASYFEYTIEKKEPEQLQRSTERKI